MSNLVFDGDSYVHNGVRYGRVNSDATICKQLARLKVLKDVFKIDHQYYINSLNIVKVKWAGKFFDYETLAKRFPMMDIGVDLEVA